MAEDKQTVKLKFNINKSKCNIHFELGSYAVHHALGERQTVCWGLTTLYLTIHLVVKANNVFPRQAECDPTAQIIMIKAKKSAVFFITLCP